MNTKFPSRRRFLKTATTASVATAAGPMLVAPSVLGRDESGKIAPNSRIGLACIGVGGMGTGNLNSFLQDERVQVVAICDVDRDHRKRGLEIAKLEESDGYNDFREILQRPGIDAVMIATPDHWHSLITTAAVQAGKDVYCEKPLAASIGEGRFVSNLVRRSGRVLQCGTWRRSGVHTRMACEWVRNRYIGELTKIEVGVPAKFAIQGGYTGLEGPEPVPGGFDYALWTGSAPRAPYTAGRCHFNFRWVMDYAPGYTTDWGAHFLDVAQWGNGTDDSGPVEVSATDVSRREKGYYDAPESFRIRYRYANGVEMTMVSTEDQSAWGTKFIGREGWVFTENEKLETEPKSLRTTKLKDSDIKLYVSKNHHRNFIDCVLSRQPTAAPVEAAHRAASACHLGAIASIVGHPLEFNPERETFQGEKAEAANALVMRSFHGGWKLT